MVGSRERSFRISMWIFASFCYAFILATVIVAASELL